jgi:Fe-S-cluster-containing dehydrogenase component
MKTEPEQEPANQVAAKPGRSVKMKKERTKTGRRDFLRHAGGALAGAGVVAGACGLAACGLPTQSHKESADKAASFPTSDYDWTEHRWAYGIDVTKCIGCLRCVEACKSENGVVRDAHHFRTWVERYVYLEGESKPRVDSHADPLNIEASGSEAEYRFDNRYKDKKVSKAFFVPKMCNHCDHPACVQVCPVGATFKAEDGTVLIDHDYCIGCRYCVQACPYGARFFDEEEGVSDKCTWCYHRITKGLNPACVEVCPTGARVFGDLREPDGPINQFINKNQVQVLKPESGNAPMCFYVGLDKDVT